MSDGRAVTISNADFDLIEAAVMETERGRWFLREYARRNRNADTQVLLGAIERLEQAVAGERMAQDVERLRFNLTDMARAIARTKAEIASGGADRGDLLGASEALDAVIRQTETATSDILAAAEHVQEAAWTLREAGADPKLCDDLDRRATEIYTACSFQDLTAQRIAKIIHTLRYLETRIHAMIEIGGEDESAGSPAEEPLSGPSPGQETLSQSDVDSVIVDIDALDPEIAFADVEEQPAPPPAPEPAIEDDAVDLDSLVEIDRLPQRERLKLFT